MVEKIMNAVLSNLDKISNKYKYENGKIDALSILSYIEKNNIELDSNEKNSEYYCFNLSKSKYYKFNVYPYFLVNAFLIKDNILEQYIDNIKDIRKYYYVKKLSKLITEVIYDTELYNDKNILSLMINYTNFVYNFIYKDEIYIIHKKNFNIMEHLEGGNVIYPCCDKYKNINEFMDLYSKDFIYLNFYETNIHIFIVYQTENMIMEQECVFRYSPSFEINDYIENMEKLEKFIFFSDLFDKYYNNINYLPPNINYLEINTLKFFNIDVLKYSNLNFDKIVVDWIEYIDGVNINTNEIVIRNLINMNEDYFIDMISNNTIITISDDTLVEITNDVTGDIESGEIDKFIEYIEYKGYSVYKEVIEKKKFINYQFQ